MANIGGSAGDYAHSEDYIDIALNGSHYRDHGKKWTTQEMIDECLKVIKELKEIKESKQYDQN